MTHEKAISRLAFIAQEASDNDLLEEVDQEALNYIFRFLNRFKGAVELTDSVGYIKKHEDGFLQAFTSNYKLYAIQKEQNNER